MSVAADDDIRDRIDRLGYNRIGFGQDETTAGALERLDRMAVLGRELAELCEQRAALLRAEESAQPSAS